MKLLVFGATDGTGQQIVEQALAHSHEVTAVVRNPSAWFVQAPRLHVEKGDVLHCETPGRVMEGHEVIISALGNGSGRGPTILYSRGTRSIVNAMMQYDRLRLMILTAVPLSTIMLSFPCPSHCQTYA